MSKRLLNVPPSTWAIVVIIACAVTALYLVQEIERVIDNEKRDNITAKRNVQLDLQTNVSKTILGSLEESRHKEHLEQTELLLSINKSLSASRQTEHKEILDALNHLINLTNDLGNKTLK